MRRAFLFILCLWASSFIYATENSFVADENSSFELVSPIEGTWSNKQPLVLSVKKDVDVYYSLNGDDPLISGFAYDGPVLIDMSGDIEVRIVAVSQERSERRFIRYSVIETNDFSFGTDDIFLGISTDTSLLIPENFSYQIKSNGIQPGGVNLQYENLISFEEYFPLVIYGTDAQWRFVVKPRVQLRSEIPSPSNLPFSFQDWNYLILSATESLVYFLDGNELVLGETNRFYIDREIEHTLSWRDITADEYEEKSFLISALPKVDGMPKKRAVNEAVILSCPENFMFLCTIEGGDKLYTSELIFDVLKGDARGFSPSIELYYKGIKQGSFNLSFVIDKISPPPPKIIPAINDFYVRKAFPVAFESDYEVYYTIKNPIASQNGFSIKRYDSEKFPPLAIKEDDFLAYEQEAVMLNNDETAALLYTIYAYSKDAAGNKSDLCSYRVIIDTANYYIDSDYKPSENSVSDGTFLSPYTTLAPLKELAKSDSKKVVYVKGSFVDLPSFAVEGAIEIRGDGNTHFIFLPDNGLVIRGGNLILSGCTLEYSNSSKDSFLHSKTMIDSIAGDITLIDCEFISHLGVSGSCIQVKNSKLSIVDIGITVQSPSYACAISAENSTLLIGRLRSVTVAQTSAGIHLQSSSLWLKDANITVLASLPRGVESIDSQLYIMDSFFSSKAKSDLSAVWVDSRSKIKESTNNRIEGFKTFGVE